MYNPFKSLMKCGAVAALAAAPLLTGCVSSGAGAGGSTPMAAAESRASVVPGWDRAGSPTWTTNQGRAPTPTAVPEYSESPYALTGDGTSGRPDAADAWRQSNPRFGVGNAVILVPPPR